MASIVSSLLLLFLVPCDAGILRGGGLLTKRFRLNSQHVDFLHLKHLEESRGYGAKASNSTTHFYNEAVLDHFGDGIPSASSVSHWSQRYYVDDTFWGGDDFPVFLYIGGEGPQGPVSPSLFMYELAQEHQALVLALEHRFYGESQPTEDMSISNLKFLTSHQALADLARFVEYVKSSGPETMDNASTPPLELKASAVNSKVVVFGGSYPGDLSAWFKLKYPGIISGSIASSAPVFGEYNFEQYAQVVGTALAYELIGGSSECYSAVKKASDLLHELVTSTSPYGTSKKIPDALKPCSEIKSDLDLSTYESQVMGAFQGVVQYNLEGRKPYVSDLCNAMTNETETDLLERLSSTLALVYEGQSCLPSSFQDDNVSPLADTKFSRKGCDLECSSMRQWIYQSCHEFGFFQTSTGGHMNPFISLDSLGIKNAGAEICKQAYNVSGDYTGPASNPAGLVANTAYGARDLASHNITIVNGNMDPWHALGIINSTDPFFNDGDGASRFSQQVTASESIVLIDGTAHCRDMYATNVFGEDTVPIVWAHEVIRTNVAKYVG